MDKPDFKHYLLSGQFLNLLGKRKYFSLEDLQAVLLKKYPDMTRGTLSRYMVELIKTELVYSAGRGWYSVLKDPFEIDHKYVKAIIDLLAKKYPALAFSCWSTEQVKSYVHHMLSKFVTFVFMDWDAMEDVRYFLESQGYVVWVNPRGRDIDRFRVATEKTVVIRPTISVELTDRHYALIERILVDLLVESRKLSLMDESECDTVRVNILSSGRVNIASLVYYSKRRNVKVDKNALGLIH